MHLLANNTQCVLNNFNQQTNEIPSWRRKNMHYIRINNKVVKEVPLTYTIINPLDHFYRCNLSPEPSNSIFTKWIIWRERFHTLEPIKVWDKTCFLRAVCSVCVIGRFFLHILRKRNWYRGIPVWKEGMGAVCGCYNYVEELKAVPVKGRQFYIVGHHPGCSQSILSAGWSIGETVRA